MEEFRSRCQELQKQLQQKELKTDSVHDIHTQIEALKATHQKEIDRLKSKQVILFQVLVLIGLVLCRNGKGYE